MEETLPAMDIGEETCEEIYKSTKWNIPVLFFQGDDVVLVVLSLRAG